MRRVRGLVSGVVLATAAALGPGVVPAQAEDALTNASAPTITGDPNVGEVLTADPGTWDPDLDGTTFTYQWQRDGAPIADAPEHEVTGDDCGHSLSVVVTASADGYAAGTAPSPAVSVSCAIVDPVSRPIRARLADRVVALSQHPRVVVRLRRPADGVVGRLSVRVDGKPARTVRMLESDHCRRVVRLPRQSLGRHEVVATFSEPGTMTSSRDAVTLRVRRPTR